METETPPQSAYDYSAKINTLITVELASKYLQYPGNEVTKINNNDNNGGVVLASHCISLSLIGILHNRLILLYNIVRPI